MSKPTESELEILSLLWEMKEASVRQVHERLAEIKDTGYTTTLKTMQNMHAKGMVNRNEEQRTHVYRPITNQKGDPKVTSEKFGDYSIWWLSAEIGTPSIGRRKPFEGGIG